MREEEGWGGEGGGVHACKEGGEERGAVFMPVRRVGKEGSGVHAEAGGGRREGEAGTCKQAC